MCQKRREEFLNPLAMKAEDIAKTSPRISPEQRQERVVHP